MCMWYVLELQRGTLFILVLCFVVSSLEASSVDVLTRSILQYGTVRYARYGTVPYRTMQYSKMRHGTVRFGTSCKVRDGTERLRRCGRATAVRWTPMTNVRGHHGLVLSCTELHRTMLYCTVLYCALLSPRPRPPRPPFHAFPSSSLPCLASFRYTLLCSAPLFFAPLCASRLPFLFLLSFAMPFSAPRCSPLSLLLLPLPLHLILSRPPLSPPPARAPHFDPLCSAPSPPPVASPCLDSLCSLSPYLPRPRWRRKRRWRRRRRLSGGTWRGG